MIKRLEHSIEKLYEVFGEYNAEDMNGSPLYEDLEDWNNEILSGPLRELNQKSLSRFTGKAITTWGSVNDYKHFLPRIFELTAELRTPYEVWIAFDKLSIAEWQYWVEEERNSILEFMLSLWINILNDNSEKAEVEFKDYFSSIANYYPEFTEILKIWSETESKAAMKHLSTYIIEEQEALFQRRKISGFNDKKENAQELIDWMLSEEVLNKIQSSYLEFESEDFSDKISWAEQILTSERKRISNT